MIGLLIRRASRSLRSGTGLAPRRLGAPPAAAHPDRVRLEALVVAGADFGATREIIDRLVADVGGAAELAVVVLAVGDPLADVAAHVAKPRKAALAVRDAAGLHGRAPARSGLVVRADVAAGRLVLASVGKLPLLVTAAGREPFLAAAKPPAEKAAQRLRAVMVDAVDRMLAARRLARVAGLVHARRLAAARLDAGLELVDGRLRRENVEQLGRMPDPTVLFRAGLGGLCERSQ